MMAINRKSSQKLNYWARWRLGLQGFTFSALFVTMYQKERVKHDSPWPWDWVDPKTGRLMTLARNFSDIGDEK